MHRRAFSGAVFAGLGLTSLSARPAKPRPGATPMRDFGRTGVKLTVVGQGGARLALLRTKEAARAHVRYAYDLGLNYFDCAHSYWEGHSEEVYGDVLSGVRKKVFITSKCAWMSGARARIPDAAVPPLPALPRGKKRMRMRGLPGCMVTCGSAV